MTADAPEAGLAAILDALTLVQRQLDAVTRGNARIEATQKNILGRLDMVDAEQAAVTDLVPVLEMLLSRSIEDRDLTRDQLSTVAAIAGFAYSAAKGDTAPLPIAIADDPILERFALTQPADRTSPERTLRDWRRAASGAGSQELVSLLMHQYQPSPTDTSETRVMRYQLAAISRAELEGRGVVPPSPPATTRSQDDSADACRRKSESLASLWRAGESADLFAEPELAGALDLFFNAERGEADRNEERLSADLAELHGTLGDRVAAGERPSLSDRRSGYAEDQTTSRQFDR